MFYIDVDALCKLAHWGILPDLPLLLNSSWDQMATVSSLRYRVERAIKSPDGRLFRTKEAAISANDCIKKMAQPGCPDENLLVQLVEIPQVDPGEAVQLALAAMDPNGIFITGDKRALRAIGTHQLSLKFTGKVICVEQLLMCCLDVKGRDWLLSHVCPMREIDKAVSIVLGSRCDAQPDDLKTGLESYINEIRSFCNPPLLAKINAL